MADSQTVAKVKRQRRFISFEARKPRERNSCPKCGSLDVKKKRDTYEYVCRKCKWKGQSIKKIMV